VIWQWIFGWLMHSAMVNWLGLYFKLNEIGREKRRAFSTRHSNSLRARRPSHSCILVLALVVVVVPHCSIVKEIYNLVFPSAWFFQVWVSYSSIHDGYSTLWINFWLSISHGLCVSWVVMRYLNRVLVFVFVSVVSYRDYSVLLAL